jgi:mannose-6-phosphate isomerase-like protein (cupin superfamily)
MKYQTNTNRVIRSSFTLALVLAIWFPVPARSAEPAEGKNVTKAKMTENTEDQETKRTASLASNTPVEQNNTGAIMKGYVQDIESLAVKNNDFRRVLYTAENCQLVLMALKPKEEIGAEVHQADQFFRVEEGSGEVIIAGVRTAILAGFAVVVPGGTEHNIINTGSVSLKLYTLYAPPNHRDGVVHHTRADAQADNEHFDGKTTE